MSLMMHCGAKPIHFDGLMDIPTPDPTDTHFPLPHHELYQLARARLLANGFEITNTQHFVNRGGAHYFNLMELQTVDERMDESYSTMAALRNSHDKMFSASLAIGARVFVCDNLSFSGDIVVGRKHTANIRDELPERLLEAIKRITVMRKKQDVRFKEYRRAPLDDRTADHLLMEAFRKGIINLQRIGKAHEEWATPSADHGDKTVWRFFNAITAALRVKSNAQLVTLPKRTIDLHVLMDKFCDVDQVLEGDFTDVTDHTETSH